MLDRELVRGRWKVTHCKHGHRLTEENSAWYARGDYSEVRHCLTCRTGRNTGPRTHCKYGHEFTEENTALVSNGSRNIARRCITCRQAYRREWERRRKVA